MVQKTIKELDPISIPNPDGQAGVGNPIVTSTIEQDPNGQVRIRVRADLNGVIDERLVGIGAEDGNDAIAELSDEDLQAAIQAILDSARRWVAKIVAGRARVAAAAANLK